MRLPFDPNHLEAPLGVVIAAYATLASVGMAMWQWLGTALAQIPTPDQVSGWQERDVYLCTAIAAVIGVGVILRWVATKMLKSEADSTAAMQAQAASNDNVARAIVGLTNRIDGVVMQSVQRAMDDTFQPGAPNLNSRRNHP